MISTERYFINVDNGTVVPWTSEICENYKFREITLAVAMAIENGRISTEDVIKQITKQITPGTLEQMLNSKIKMNVREGELNLESQIRDDNSQADTGTPSPFKINVQNEQSSKRVQTKKTETNTEKEESFDEEKNDPAGSEQKDQNGSVMQTPYSVKY